MDDHISTAFTARSLILEREDRIQDISKKGSLVPRYTPFGVPTPPQLSSLQVQNIAQLKSEQSHIRTIAEERIDKAIQAIPIQEQRAAKNEVQGILNGDRDVELKAQNGLQTSRQDRVDSPLGKELAKDAEVLARQESAARGTMERAVPEQNTKSDSVTNPPWTLYDKGRLKQHFNEKAAPPPGGGGGDKGRSPNDPSSPGSGGGPGQPSPGPEKNDNTEQSRPSRFMQSFNRASAKSPESRQQEQIKAEGPSPSGFLKGSMGRTAPQKDAAQPDKNAQPQQEQPGVAGFMRSFQHERVPANDNDKGRSQETRPVKTGTGRDDR